MVEPEPVIVPKYDLNSLTNTHGRVWIPGTEMPSTVGRDAVFRRERRRLKGDSKRRHFNVMPWNTGSRARDTGRYHDQRMPLLQNSKRESHMPQTSITDNEAGYGTLGRTLGRVRSDPWRLTKDWDPCKDPIRPGERTKWLDAALDRGKEKARKQHAADAGFHHDEPPAVPPTTTPTTNEPTKLPLQTTTLQQTSDLMHRHTPNYDPTGMIYAQQGIRDHSRLPVHSIGVFQTAEARRRAGVRNKPRFVPFSNKGAAFR